MQTEKHLKYIGRSKSEIYVVYRKHISHKLQKSGLLRTKCTFFRMATNVNVPHQQNESETEVWSLFSSQCSIASAFAIPKCTWEWNCANLNRIQSEKYLRNRRDSLWFLLWMDVVELEGYFHHTHTENNIISQHVNIVSIFSHFYCYKFANKLKSECECNCTISANRKHSWPLQIHPIQSKGFSQYFHRIESSAVGRGGQFFYLIFSLRFFSFRSIEKCIFAEIIPEIGS